MKRVKGYLIKRGRNGDVVGWKLFEGTSDELEEELRSGRWDGFCPE